MFLLRFNRSLILQSTISTGRLNALRHFHRPPINLVVYKGSSSPYGDTRSYLEGGFPLRCFQRLSVGNLATQRCSFLEQLAHQGFPHPSPLVLGTDLLKSQTVVLDRVRTVLRMLIHCFQWHRLYLIPLVSPKSESRTRRVTSSKS